MSGKRMSRELVAALELNAIAMKKKAVNIFFMFFMK
jgi:hypothetical protein